MVANYIVCTLITRELRPPFVCQWPQIIIFHFLHDVERVRGHAHEHMSDVLPVDAFFSFLGQPDQRPLPASSASASQLGPDDRIRTWQLASRTHYCAALLPTPLIQLNTCFDRRLRGVCRLSLAEVTIHINELRFNCFISFVSELILVVKWRWLFCNRRVSLPNWKQWTWLKYISMYFQVAYNPYSLTRTMYIRPLNYYYKVI